MTNEERIIRLCEQTHRLANAESLLREAIEYIMDNVGKYDFYGTPKIVKNIKAFLEENK